MAPVDARHRGLRGRARAPGFRRLLRTVSDSLPLASTDSGRDLTVLNDAVPVGDVDGDGALDAGDIMAIVQREADPGMVLDGDPYCPFRDVYGSSGSSSALGPRSVSLREPFALVSWYPLLWVG